MTQLRIGVQFHPQATSVEAMRQAWRTADEMGADSIWTWDHFYPLYGDPDAPHFEGWTLLSVMAADTSRAKLGMLVTGNNYRNPETDLLSHMVSASRHAHWLNPEPRHLWGSGDSAIPRSQDLIPMHECRSAKQLASVIDALLPV